MEHMLEDYMLENIANGKCLLAGYPRNTIFFDEERRASLRKEFANDDTKIYAYMPTWRGAIGNIDSDANDKIKKYLGELDKLLNDKEILYVNLHPIAVKNIDFSGFSRIKKFPKNLETYDFLNCTDCLITDYSSVIFEASILNIPMAFYAKDLEEFIATRDFYCDFLYFIPGDFFDDINEVALLAKENRADMERIRAFKYRAFGDTIGNACSNISSFVKSLMS
jgi:CDP-glycerol glycerophosphotransferase